MTTTNTSQEEWQREHREQYLAYCLPSAARIQFHTAISTIKYRSLTEPQETRDEFEACLKALEQIHLIGRLLREDGHKVMMDDGPLNDQFSRDLMRRLFYSLDRRTKRILREQGLRP
jgi:folylpolyglutamate synthase/dihydropteroate synthase